MWKWDSTRTQKDHFEQIRACDARCDWIIRSVELFSSTTFSLCRKVFTKKNASPYFVHNNLIKPHTRSNVVWRNTKSVGKRKINYPRKYEHVSFRNWLTVSDTHISMKKLNNGESNAMVYYKQRFLLFFLLMISIIEFLICKYGKINRLLSNEVKTNLSWDGQLVHEIHIGVLIQ